MSLLATIVNEANSKTLPFLVIGGHAVNAHGFSRFTKDVDFLVRRENSREWEEILAGLGFTAHRSEASFIQLFAVTGCAKSATSMAPVKSTNDSSPSAHEMNEAALAYRVGEPALDFPISLGFNSKPPRLSPSEHLQWCEQMIKTNPRAQVIFSSPVLAEFVL